MEKLYLIVSIAEKRNVNMIMPFYVKAKSIQSAIGKGIQELKDYGSRHKITIVKVEECNERN